MYIIYFVLVNKKFIRKLEKNYCIKQKDIFLNGK